MTTNDFNQTVERLKSHISCRDIIDNLGIESKRKGRRTEFLCLNHPDRHLGNCVAEDGFVHCFACGWHTDQIGLVQKAVETGRISGGTQPNDFKAACEIIAGWTGDSISWDSAKQNLPEPLRFSLSELELLGILDTKSFRELYEENRNEFWVFLERCSDYCNQGITVATIREEIPEVKSVLEHYGKQFCSLNIKIREQKEKNKADTPLYICSE